MKRYINKIKESPEQLLFDVINTALVFFVIGMLIAVVQWIVNVFGGQILVNPLALAIGSWSIYWYGIFFALSFIFGFLVIFKESQRTNKNIDQIITILFWTIIFGFLGARLVFAILNWSFYATNPIQILNIWQGGLSIYGAIFTGSAFILIYSAVKKISSKSILDTFTLALIIGQAVGRWGNLFSQEYFGKPSEWLKVYIAPINRPWEYRNYSFFQPLFFYESIFCLILFVALVILKKTKKIQTGFAFLYYLLFYSAFRFGIEFLALDPKIFWKLDLAQIASAVVFLISLIAIIYRCHAKSKKK